MNNNKQIKVIRDKLNTVISDMAEHTELYAKNPEKDFTRNRKLNFETLVKFILSMQGGSLNREMYKYFQGDDITSVSAFVQQRDKSYRLIHLRSYLTVLMLSAMIINYLIISIDYLP